MDNIINIGGQLGWLSNVMTIILGVITFWGIFAGIKNRLRRNSSNYKFSDIKSFVKSNNWKGMSIKKRKVAIVDDNPENYPSQYLNRCGYNITVYDSISLTSIEFLLNYDLVILDITGIVEEDLQKGGLEVIKRLKSRSPEQLIISASSKRFDPTLTEFFRLADDQIKTPIESTALEEKIRKVLSDRFSPEIIAEKADDLLSGKNLSNSDREKLLKISFNYLDDKFSEKEFMKKVSWISYAVDVHAYRSLLDRIKIAR